MLQQHLHPPNNSLLRQRPDGAAEHMTSLPQRRGWCTSQKGPLNSSTLERRYSMHRARLKPQNETVIPTNKNRPKKRTNKPPVIESRSAISCSGFPSPGDCSAYVPTESSAGRIYTSHLGHHRTGSVLAKFSCSLLSANSLAKEDAWTPDRRNGFGCVESPDNR
jgi:hypothetical protein